MRKYVVSSRAKSYNFNFTVGWKVCNRNFWRVNVNTENSATTPSRGAPVVRKFMISQSKLYLSRVLGNLLGRKLCTKIHTFASFHRKQRGSSRCGHYLRRQCNRMARRCHVSLLRKRSTTDEGKFFQTEPDCRQIELKGRLAWIRRFFMLS